MRLTKLPLNCRYDNASDPRLSNTPVKTYFFDSNGNSLFYVHELTDTTWNDTACARMVSPDSLHFEQIIDLHPTFDIVKVDMAYDPYGNVLHYKEVYKCMGDADTSYVYYFVNHYRDGTTTGAL